MSPFPPQPIEWVPPGWEPLTINDLLWKQHFQSTVHELGHVVAGFDHPPTGLCSDPTDTVMYDEDPLDTKPYFCLNEIGKLRQSLRFPSKEGD